MHLELADANQKLYVCPGESVPISHSVHLGRLAQCYPACQACPLNTETGATPMPVVDRLKAKHDRQQAEVHTSFGQIRGVYLNRIDRRVTSDIIGQFASELWNDIHRSAKTHRREKIGSWVAPRVVIGYDQRSSSPDIVTGIQDRLRLMGCDVVDVGLTIGPALQYAIRHHRATCGVFVSGSGFPPSWTGFDFFNERGLPREIGNLVIPNIGAAPMQHARPLRSSGAHTFKPIGNDYAGRLQKLVRCRKPLRVCVGIEDAVAKEHVRIVFESLGARLSFVDLPKRPRDLTDLDDPDAIRVGHAVVEAEADLGFVIDEDMRHCLLIDDQGDSAFPAEIASALAKAPTFVHKSAKWYELIAENPDASLVCGKSMYAFPKQSIQCDAAATLVQFVNQFSRLKQSVSEFAASRSV